MTTFTKKQLQNIILCLICAVAVISIGFIAIVSNSIVATAGGSLIITFIGLLSAGYILEFFNL